MWSRSVVSRLLAGRTARWLRRSALVCLPAATAIATPACAKVAANVSSRALIIEPLSLVKNQDLDFGKIASPAATGTIVLIPTPVASCSTTNGIVRTGTCRAAEFYGYGTSGRLVNINRPNAPIVISNGSQTMNITNVTLNGSPDLAYVSGNINGNGVLRYRIASLSGAFSFRIGGTLQVNAGQQAGTYSGTFQVTIMYQ